MRQTNLSKVAGALFALSAAALIAAVAASLPGAGAGSAAVTNSIVTADGDGVNQGQNSSLALDVDGFPVASYDAVGIVANEGTLGIRVMRCNDANCTGGDEAFHFIPTGVNSRTSLALDGAGFPVVAFSAVVPALHILHCNDANCAGNDESDTSPDSTVNFSDEFLSMALDSSGFPVVAYVRSGLRLMHCNDANCAGNDESITTPAGGIPGPRDLSLKLDASGFPVVAVFNGVENNQSTGDLFILHCNDANCAGADESLTQSPDSAADIVGSFNSLALDASGFPTVSYRDLGNFRLKLMHCNDANCAGGDESVTIADTVSPGNPGKSTSVVLDSNGFPVISENFDSGGDSSTAVVHCNDANCAGSDEHVFALEKNSLSDRGTSIRLDANGFPVVSYYFVGGVLRLAHCGDANCSLPPPPTATPTATITNTPTVTNTPAPTATQTSTATVTSTALPATPTDTPTVTATAIPATATNTASPTATNTSTSTPVPSTATPTHTATATNTPTNTPVPPTATPANTQVPATATSTATSASTSTNTPVPSTSTATPSSTNTATNTATNTPVATDTPTSTATSTPTATATNTAVATSTSTSTATATSTPLPPTVTPSSTPTRSATPEVGCFDVTGDGRVDFRDVRRMLTAIRQHDWRYDLNGDGRTTGRDLVLVIKHLGQSC